MVKEKITKIWKECHSKRKKYDQIAASTSVEILNKEFSKNLLLENNLSDLKTKLRMWDVSKKLSRTIKWVKCEEPE